MKEKQKCTMCGKKFEQHDMYANLNFEKQIGYGSIHDGETVKLNLCCNCFDRLVDILKLISVEDVLIEKSVENRNFFC